jgi:8-oxo-dGTP pyrophosphatase MutT (NUDIX family)
MSTPHPTPGLRAAPGAPRPAASLLVLRHEGEGFRHGRQGRESVAVLMARRSPEHRFLPNVLVFPGGAVDEADLHARAATPLRPEVRSRLERSADPRLVHGLGIAAARELEEEVGLSLGHPPRLGALAYFCRAITPAGYPIRFDVRFFVVAATELSGQPRSSEELLDPRFYLLEEALAEDLVRPTRLVLERLRHFLAHQDHAGPVPVLREGGWTEE